MNPEPRAQNQTENGSRVSVLGSAKLILASASPRRRELLSRLGLPFDVRPVDLVEDVTGGLRADVLARRLARAKAEAARLLDATSPILAADTIVVHENILLGKPGDAAEARAMLRSLRGRAHVVVTGVAVMPEGRRSVMARQPVTDVRMRSYGDDEIEASIARGDPFDKAGGYGIQDPLFQPVASYDGCYCNVVGLPLWSTIELLGRAGFDVTSIDARQLLPQCATCPLRPRR